MRRLRSLLARARREEGYVALELALAAGALVLPVAIMVVTLPTWVERQSLATSAAQEGARAVVLADSWDQGVSEAGALVREMAVTDGIPPDEVRVAFSGSLDRGALVTASVTVSVPAASFPFFGSVGAWPLTRSDTEKVDLYRSFP